MNLGESFKRILAGAVLLGSLGMADTAVAQDRMCERTVKANVVALDQPIWLNRLGANIPAGMMFALARDVVDKTTGASCDAGVQNTPPTQCKAGNVKLREDKRPRPIVLRANEGDCLQIVFTNLLTGPAGGSLLAAAADEPGPKPGSSIRDTRANILQRRAAERLGTLRGKPLADKLEKESEEAPAPATPSVTAEEEAAALPPVVTRAASIHVQGLPWVSAPSGTPLKKGLDDGSRVGGNADSLAQPGQTRIYTLFAEHEGSYVLYSTADDWFPAVAAGGALPYGLFGSVNVEPSESDIKPFGKKWRDTQWYRSQATEEELCLAAQGSSYTPAAGCTRAPGSKLVIDYQALYPANYKDPSRRNLPVLNMLCNPAAVTRKGCQANEIVHTDLTAIITGPNASHFPAGLPPADQPPALRAISLLPDRLQPFREFTVIYHESFAVTQAFPDLYSEITSLGSAADNFGINYGMGGIVSEILANRMGVGPMKDCTECKYEEFFLSSWSVGDPAMVVDKPATDCADTHTKKPIPGCQATQALYPGDPSNVYPSYLGDHVRFRVLHGGSDLHHVHHQHAHQWLHTPNSPNADYTDSQSIGPGSSFTMEMAYYGSGNVNQTVGDSIFHCHFYAHFASGMWSLWRVFDTLQTGTPMKDGKPAPNSRAYPDGEIIVGTPIPAVVPVPTLPMPLAPAPVRLTDQGKKYEVQVVEGGAPKWIDPYGSGPAGAADLNPGYPFFIPGIGGHRPPHPPLDFAYACSDNGMRCAPGTAGEPKDLSLCQNAGTATCDPLDGGLPRHVIQSADVTMPTANDTDFSKILKTSDAFQLAEEGTRVEKIAMQAHSRRLSTTCRPDGTCNGTCSDNGAPCDLGDPTVVGRWQCGNPKTASCEDKPVTYVLNGLPPKPGAPYADPCIKFSRNGGPAPDSLTRRYLAADIQLDAIFNKEGWHFPQQRMISLWGDVQKTLDGTRPPEPFFFRANSNDCIEYTLANLVSNVYELDEFQVRTPTDILGQHIHLVKFDVTSSDGAGNGWNYEDGTFAPNEVTERITAMNKVGSGSDKGIDTRYVGGTQRKKLTPKPIKYFGDGPGGTWIGAQATIQRWYGDPLYDNGGACSNNPDQPCTLIDVSKCGDVKATCDVSAGFCSTDFNKTCTASTAAARCGAAGECISRHDRTLRTVFTHDHFGPSTHQQAGLYAGLVIEPKGSVWRNNEDGEIFGGFDSSTGGVWNKRFDGGPTTWQAVIETPKKEQSFREFLLELQDSTLTYGPFPVRAFNLGNGAGSQFASGSYDQHCAGREPWEPCGFCGNDGVCVNAASGLPVSPLTTCLVPSPFDETNPCATGQCRLFAGVVASGGQPAVQGQLVACTPEHFEHCQGQPYDDWEAGAYNPFKSCKLISGIPAVAWNTTPIDPSLKTASPEIVTFFAATNNFSFNYRNEPLYPRTTDPYTGAVLAGNSGDLSYAFSSDKSITRPNLLGSICSQNLGLACNTGTPPTPCPAGAGTCQPASFCSDNYALCTADNKTLCGNPGTASCNRSRPYDDLTKDVQPGDPFTPLLRAYAGDDVQVRTLTGAHLNPHNFTIQGINWLLEPSFVDSGWRNSEVMGISEHFELISRIPPSHSKGTADFLYQPGAAALEQAGGNWGLLRAYDTKRADLYALPQNPEPASATVSVCPSGATTRNYKVIALTATQALGGPLVYNNKQSLSDADAILLFNAAGPVIKCTDPSDPATCGLPIACNAGKCSNGSKNACASSSDCIEPMVLRANAGDCITVDLHNEIANYKVAGNASPQLTLPYGCGINCAAASSNVSTQVGFRPQLVAFDSRTSGGANVGQNPISSGSTIVQTAGPQQKVSYTWYAGNIDATAPAAERYIPIEFGASNLMAADVMNHYFHGLIGGLVIEPQGSKGWENAGVAAQVTEKDGISQFREFVVFTQDNLLVPNPANPAKTLGIGGVNLKSEWLFTSTPRFCSQAACQEFLTSGRQDVSCMTAEAPSTGTPDLYCASNGACGKCTFTPETPTFRACAGDSVRFRVLHPGGINTNHVFELYGHNWSEAPYMTEYERCEAPTTQTNFWASQRQGTTNLCANWEYTLNHKLSLADREQGQWEASLNSWQGSRMGHGPGNHLDVLISQAGGPFRRPGDYLYRTYPAMHVQLGLWGYFRVEDKSSAFCGYTARPDRALENQLPSAGGKK